MDNKEKLFTRNVADISRGMSAEELRMFFHDVYADEFRIRETGQYSPVPFKDVWR